MRERERQRIYMYMYIYEHTVLINYGYVCMSVNTNKVFYIEFVHNTICNSWR